MHIHVFKNNYIRHTYTYAYTCHIELATVSCALARSLNHTVLYAKVFVLAIYVYEFIAYSVYNDRLTEFVLLYHKRSTKNAKNYAKN